jgi:hypothetical protein
MSSAANAKKAVITVIPTALIKYMEPVRVLYSAAEVEKIKRNAERIQDMHKKKKGGFTLMFPGRFSKKPPGLFIIDDSVSI